MMEHFFARHFPPEIEMIDGSYKCHMSYVYISELDGGKYAGTPIFDEKH